jgi:ribose 5-phosphate isomerase A
MDPKQRAAEAALEYVRSDTVIGLGSGSTSERFVIALGAALKSGRLRNVRGVPTSEHIASLARQNGIPVVSLTQAGELDVDVDGCDEVTPTLDLIKGLGGALLREKMIVQHAKRFVVIADASKTVERLGTKAPLPVEVVTFEHEATARFLKSLGSTPELRTKADGSPFVTDNGNYIYHCRFAHGIDDPAALDAALHARAGVVDTGLFLGVADVALVADDAGVRTMRAS